MSITTAAARVAHDEATAAAYGELYAAQERVARARAGIHHAAGDKKVYGWGRGQRQGVWTMTFAEALAKVEAAAAISETDAYAAFDALSWDTDREAKSAALAVYRAAGAAEAAMAKLIQANAASIAISERINELEASYTGWTRAFLVTSSVGHVHSSMNCSTCHNGQSATQFAWVTDYSDRTEAEVVEAAGWRACTVCYPTAPTTTMTKAAAKKALPSTIANDGTATVKPAATQRRTVKPAAPTYVEEAGLLF